MDRTQELFSLIQVKQTATRPTTIFTRNAQKTNQEIISLFNKLNQLASTAKSTSLFDDKQSAVNSLVNDIKHDINLINSSISNLSSLSLSANPQSSLFNQNILSSLNSKMADSSNSFKSILQQRSDLLKLQKDRRDQYSFNTPFLKENNSSLYNPLDSQDTVLDLGSSSLQMQLHNETDVSRDVAIDNIESTIQELGQIYQHFALLLTSQREQIQRIEENVFDTEVNVEGAHAQLLRFYNNMSGNRWLMVQLFAVLIFFFMLGVVLM